ncbi:MAG: hypothetical protein JNN30_12095 [Rhodanobacteraceae bacterium]|nr:hypothetical protein [Rhodanobacteraceae bacterium]
MRPVSVFARAVRLAGLAGGSIASMAALASDPVLAPYSDSPELRIEALSDTPAIRPRLRLQGNWPTPCLPEIDEIQLEGNELRIGLRSRKPLCARASVPFDIEVDLTAQLGRQWPATPLRVSVVTANDATAPSQLRGFAVITPQPGPRAVPSSGLWWPLPSDDAANPMAGTGFSFEIQGNTIAAAVLGHTGNGDAIWYFGTGQLRGSTTEIDLVAATRDGIAGERRASDDAVLTLEFDGNGRATAWLGQYERGENQPVLRQQVIALAHLPFAERTDGAAWQGDWVLLGATPGQPRSARQLRLRAETFLAVANYAINADDGSILRCERDPTAPKVAPPRRCRLTDAQNTLVAEFDAIDINRLDGFAPDGTPVQLIRADRR